jgi:hypothetical protein
MASMGKLVTAQEAARIAKRSRSQINRDAKDGKLPTAQQFPGYKGARLFDEDEVRAVYRETQEAMS